MEKTIEVKNDNEDSKILFGWKCAEECAVSVWSSIHSILLEGELVFGYRDITGKSDLSQIVITKNIREDLVAKYGLSFSVGVITKGYTSLVPILSLGEIEKNIPKDMKGWGVSKEIIESFKKVISKFNKE